MLQTPQIVTVLQLVINPLSLVAEKISSLSKLVISASSTASGVR